MARDLFISHSSAEASVAAALAKDIEARGISCWMAPRDVPPGKAYQEQIVEAIDSCGAMLLLFSKSANESEHVLREVELASNAKKPIYPLQLGDERPERGLKFLLANKQWIERKALEGRLAEILEQLLRGSLGSNPPPPPPVPQASRWWIAVAAVAVLTAGGMLIGRSWLSPSSDPVKTPAVTGSPLASAVPPAATGNAGLLPAAGAASPAAPVPAATPPVPVPQIAAAPVMATPSGEQASALPGLPAAPEPQKTVTPNIEAVPALPKPIPAPVPQIAAAPVIAAASGEQPSALPKSAPAPEPQSAPAAVTAAPAGEQAPAVSKLPPAPVPQVVAVAVIAAPSGAQVPALPISAPAAPSQSVLPPASPALAVAALAPASGIAWTQPSYFRDCAKCPTMAVIPAGTALLGAPAGERGAKQSEQPQRDVRFARSFAIARMEASFDEWQACVSEGGCDGWSPDDFGMGNGRNPVIFVSWSDANAYAKWLSAKTGATYRLPSEAEWEYAARACRDAGCGNPPFSFGAEI